jgi:hypothetical protein
MGCDDDDDARDNPESTANAVGRAGRSATPGDNWVTL